jgi:hypothetical protein
MQTGAFFCSQNIMNGEVEIVHFGGFVWTTCNCPKKISGRVFNSNTSTKGCTTANCTFEEMAIEDYFSQ